MLSAQAALLFDLCECLLNLCPSLTTSGSSQVLQTKDIPRQPVKAQISLEVAVQVHFRTSSDIYGLCTCTAAIECLSQL